MGEPELCAQPLCCTVSGGCHVNRSIVWVPQRNGCPGEVFIISETHEHTALFWIPNSVIICPCVFRTGLVYACCQGVINNSALKSVPIWKIKYIVILCRQSNGYSLVKTKSTWKLTCCADDFLYTQEMDGVEENLFYNGNTKEVTPLTCRAGGTKQQKKNQTNK